MKMTPLATVTSTSCTLGVIKAKLKSEIFMLKKKGENKRNNERRVPAFTHNTTQYAKGFHGTEAKNCQFTTFTQCWSTRYIWLTPRSETI